MIVERESIIRLQAIVATNLGIKLPTSSGSLYNDTSFMTPFIKVATANIKYVPPPKNSLLKYLRDYSCLS